MCPCTWVCASLRLIESRWVDDVLLWQMKTVCTRIRQGPYLETMVLMLAKAPPSLHERVVTCLQLMSTDARVRFDMRSHAGALAEGLARATGGTAARPFQSQW